MVMRPHWDRRTVRKALRNRDQVEASPLRGYALTLARLLDGARVVHPRHPEPRSRVSVASAPGVPRALRKRRKEDRRGV